jgi:hypothetical protein
MFELDPDLRFVDAALPANGAPSRFDELMLVEDEAACAAPGGENHNLAAARAGAANHVLKVLFNVCWPDAQFPSQRGNRPRLDRQKRQHVLSSCHSSPARR